MQSAAQEIKQEIKSDASYERALVLEKERKEMQNVLHGILSGMSLPVIKLMVEHFSVEDFELRRFNIVSNNYITEMQKEVEIKRAERSQAAIKPYFENENNAALRLNYSGELPVVVDDVYRAYGLNDYEEEKDNYHLAEAKKCVEPADKKKFDMCDETQLMHIAYNAAKSGPLKTLQYLAAVKSTLLTSTLYYIYEKAGYKVRLLLVALKAEQRLLARWLLENYVPCNQGSDGQRFDYDTPKSFYSSEVHINHASLALCIYLQDFEFAYGLLNKGVKSSIGQIDNFKMLSIFSLFGNEAKKENDVLKSRKMEISNLFKNYLNPQSLITTIKNRSWRHYDRAMTVYKALCLAESSTEMLEIVEAQELILRGKKLDSSYPRLLKDQHRWLDSQRVTNRFSEDDAFCKILLCVSAILNPNDCFARNVQHQSRLKKE